MAAVLPISSSGLKYAPVNANAPSLVPSGTNWTWGAWTELLSATTTHTYLAGITFQSQASYGSEELEIQIGTGTAGNEVGWGGIFRISLPNSGQGSNGGFLLPVPVGTLPSGTRISARVRAPGVRTDAFQCTLLYYEDLASASFVDGGVVSLTCAPLGADGIDIAANGTAWAWSAWYQLTSGVGHEVGLVGLAVLNKIQDTDREWQIGAGSPPTPVASLLQPAMNRLSGLIWNAFLPAVVPVAPNLPISVRVRQSATDTQAQRTALLYYDNLVDSGPSVTYTTDTLAIRRLRQSPHLTADLRRLFVSRFQLHLQPGLGTTTTSDPQVMFAASTDGGRTWGPERLMSAGAVGAYTKRALTWRLGMGRDWVFRVTVSDPVVPWALLNAFLDADPGTS